MKNMTKTEGLRVTEPNKHFSEKITWLSFIMSVFVMYIHANNLNNTGLAYTRKSFDYNITMLLGGAIGGIAVPFFFMMSGYWYFRFDIFKKSAVKTILFKLKTRVKSLLIPYLLWNTLGMLFYMCITRIPFISKMMNVSEIIPITVKTLFKGVFCHAYYFPFWYLQNLILLTALTPLFLYILRKKKLVELIIILFVVLNFFDFSIPLLQLSSILFFLLGSYFSVYHKNVFEKRYTKKEGFIAGGVLLFRIIVYMYVPNNDIGINSLMLFVSVISLHVAIDFIDKYKLTWFKKQSFFIYASHIIPVTVIMKILSKISTGDCSASIAYLMTPWIALFIIYIAAKIVNKLMPKCYQVLCGGRM